MFRQSIREELMFKTSRSSGKGGQHVNKVETRVELIFDLQNSKVFEESEKEKIKDFLKNKISKDGFLRLYCESERSQNRNKQLIIKRLENLLELALMPEKERKATSPSKESVAVRLKEKKKNSEKKTKRGKVNLTKIDLSSFPESPIF